MGVYSAVQLRHGAVFINLDPVALFPLTDWREGRVPEPVGTEKVKKGKQKKHGAGNLRVNGLLLPSKQTRCVFLPLSSTVKTSHSPVVSKIDNRLEQYTSAAQVSSEGLKKNHTCFFYIDLDSY